MGADHGLAISIPYKEESIIGDGGHQ
jgi:hypothetical protein